MLFNSTVPPRSYRIHNVNSGDAAACHWSIRQAMVHHHAERIAQLKRITPFDIFPDHRTLLNHFHPGKKKQQNIYTEMSELSRIFWPIMCTRLNSGSIIWGHRCMTAVCWGCAAEWMFSQHLYLMSVYFSVCVLFGLNIGSLTALVMLVSCKRLFLFDWGEIILYHIRFPQPDCGNLWLYSMWSIYRFVLRVDLLPPHRL